MDKFDPTTIGGTPVTTTPSMGGGFNPSSIGGTPLTPISSFSNQNNPANANAETKPVVEGNNQSPTFQASPDDSIFGGVLKMLGNMPSSSFSFIKGALSSINPINIGKNVAQIPSEFSHLVQESGGVGNAIGATAKELLPTAYGQLVPKATQQVISGDYEGARQTLGNDPVGQILPYIMLAKGAAEKAGMGEQFDTAVSKIASPVTDTAGKVASKVADVGGKLSSQILGTSTGAGASSISEAFKGSQAFVDALRGKINPDQVVSDLKNAVQGIKYERSTAYKSQLEEIGKNTSSLDISPVVNTLKTQLDNFGVKISPDGNLDFSRSAIANNGSARADIQGVYNTLKDWGTQEGDRTPVGLDTLKKQLGDFYSDSSSARSFVQAVKSKVTGILNDQVPGYKDMTQSYQTASIFLDDIKSANGVGGKAKADTIFTKLTTAMKGDKEFRLEVLKKVEAQGTQPDLMAKIAGTNMQSFIPKGLIGKFADAGGIYATLAHFFNPVIIPALLSTSPRIVGEFVRSLGIGTEKTKAVLGAINKLTESSGYSSK